MRLVRRMMAPLQRRVALMVSRGVVQRVNAATKLQSLQVALLADELRSDVEDFERYGLTAVPFAEAEVVFLSIGGNRDHGVVLAVADRRHRPKSLQEGEVCLYDDQGLKVLLKRGGEIHLTSGDAAADALALASKCDDRLTKLQAAFDGHFHTTTATIGPSPTPGVIGSPLGTGCPVGQLDTVASDLVKAD
jgi:phage baseplate assembly protein V